MLWAGDVDFIDCGRTYGQMGVFICYSTQKSLYSYKPDDSINMQPDLAEGPPEVSEDGKTVTVKIKKGVKYSPPYDEEVTAADVKYAIERGFFSSVANGFTTSYFGDLEGAKVGVDAGHQDLGHHDARRLHASCLKFKRPVGGVDGRGRARVPGHGAGARGVRQEVRRRAAVDLRREPALDRPVHDRERRRRASRSATTRASASTWCATRTGTRALDYKPAYLDEIDNLQGNDDPGIASRRILDGESMINGDFTPPPENLKDARATTRPSSSSSRRRSAAAGSR